GYSLGYVNASEWLAYWISAAATTSYTLNARVASVGPGGVFHVEIDGIDVTGPMTVPDTGGWQIWQTISSAPAPLTSGLHMMRVVIDTKGTSGWMGNVNYFRWTAPGVNGPPTVGLTAPADGANYLAPAAIAGLIEAENFDDGGEGIAYHDLTAGNSGGQYRQTNVDIETCSDVGGGYSLGYVAVGEWLKYTVSVATTASYSFEARVASPGTGGTFHVEIDGVDATGALAVPNTGGWQTWRSVLMGCIPLSAGTHVMRVVIDTNGPLGYFGNLNYFRWTPPGFNNPPSVSLTAPANGANYFAPASIALNANASDPDGSVTQVAFYAGTSLLGTDTTSPFAFTWNSVPAGGYSLTAVATDQ